MIGRIRQHGWDLLWLAAICIWFAVFSYPYFFHAAVGSLRELQSYNLDSAVAIEAVQKGLHSRLFRLTFNDYGHFYYNLSLIVAKLYSIFAVPSDHFLITVERGFAVIGGLGAIAATYIFALHFMGRVYAMLASGIMAFSPTMLEWSNELKPDGWQLTFIMLSIYFLARAWELGSDLKRSPLPFLPAARLGYVLAASSAAGAAFGSKYLGMFLLPLIGVAMLGVSLDQVTGRHLAWFRRFLDVVALPLALLFAAIALFATPIRVVSNLLVSSDVHSASLLGLVFAGRAVCALLALLFLTVLMRKVVSFGRPLPERAWKYLTLVSATGAAFFGTFFLTSPWLFYRLDFVREIYVRSTIVESYPSFGFANWMRRLFWDGIYVSEIAAIMAISALGWLAVALVQKDWRKTHLAFIPVWGFGIIFVTMLVMKVNRATILYALPITPLLALLAAYFLWRISPIIARRLKVASTWVAAVLAFLVVVASAVETIPRVMAYPMLVTDITPDNRRLGDWLTACLPQETGNLGASYSYFPPRFQKFVGGDGQLYFDRIHPSVVILNRTIRTEVEAGPQPPSNPESIDRTKLYRLLDSWKTGPSFGVLQIYLRPDLKLSPACS
jgi:hypothetical protein